jgi:3'-phosphoadenosine 5'-phosphosulfate sulfotransferase (PAPS reductase)/FAD synthetase
MVDVHAVAIKINEAVDFARASLGEHLEGHDLMGRFILLSGGNDSTTLAHLAWFVFPSDIRATHAAHANTTIGVEETRVFVRETCAAWGLPLVEKRPPESYRQLVLDPKNGGFPGPARHWKMYTRLKERCLVQVRRDFVKEPRKQRVLFIAGRRRLESKRRANVPENSRDGSIIWTSPLVEWSADDMEAYRTLFAVPHNPVADDLGMSGECLCGAFAEPGEFERLQSLHPDAAQEIVDLEDELVSQNEVLGTLPDEVCHWGWERTGTT